MRNKATAQVIEMSQAQVVFDLFRFCWRKTKKRFGETLEEE
jgi:hypothetical protein